jgi:two-component system sensor histidine kinase SenX3
MALHHQTFTLHASRDSSDPLRYDSGMGLTSHRKSMALFITLGVVVAALVAVWNIGLIVLTWREGVMLVLGVLTGILIITGVVLNTIFLVREIRRNEQHDQFINAVTHELKTPVASIRLYLQTLQRRQLDEEKQREFYEVMLADTDRLTHTIEQVLQAGRMKAAQKSLNRERLDFGELVEECVSIARLRHHLPEGAMEVKRIAATVIGDAEELKTAVSNLLDNAIKYSKTEVHVLAEVVRLDDKNVAVRVRDQGVGISREELSRIFKRFYRIPGIVAKRVKGMGLGLYIVRSAAEKHGGRAFAESDGPGQGSTFTIQLPLAPSA